MATQIYVDAVDLNEKCLILEESVSALVYMSAIDEDSRKKLDLLLSFLENLAIDLDFHGPVTIVGC